MQANSSPEVNSRQLRAVLAVAEYRSFIAAAAFLKTSQPALTRTIKQIEGALGASLFSRSTRQVSITEAGKEFAALAEVDFDSREMAIVFRDDPGESEMSERHDARHDDLTSPLFSELAHVLDANSQIVEKPLRERSKLLPRVGN